MWLNFIKWKNKRERTIFPTLTSILRFRTSGSFSLAFPVERTRIKFRLKNRLKCYSLLCSGNQERGTINYDDLVSLPLHVVLSEIRLREINYELHQRQFGIEKNILFLFLTKKRSDETPNTNIVRKKDSPNFQIDTHLLALLFE